MFSNTSVINHKKYRNYITIVDNSTRKNSLDKKGIASSTEATPSFTVASTSPIYTTTEEIEATPIYKTDNNSGYSMSGISFSSTLPSSVIFPESTIILPSLSATSSHSIKISITESPSVKKLQTLQTKPVTPTPTITVKPMTNSTTYQSFTSSLFSSSHTIYFSSSYQSSTLSEFKSWTSLFSPTPVTTQEMTNTLSTATVKETLDVVICEPNKISINIDDLHELSIRSPQDEITGGYPINKHCVVTIHNPKQQVSSSVPIL